MSEKLILYAKPPVTRYDWRRQAEFEVDLQKTDEATFVQPLQHPNELRLDYQARTIHGGYQYMYPAFRDINTKLLSGLGMMISCLSGTRGVHLEGLDMVDGRAAIDIFNRVVGIRYRLMTSQRLVIDRANHTIDGIIASNRAMLYNRDFYRQLNVTLRRQWPSLLWYGAQTVGRRLYLWYRDTMPFATLQTGKEAWPIFAGLYFSNGEIAGMGIRGTPAFYLPNGICLAPFNKYGKMLQHRGSDLETRVEVMIEHLAKDRVARDLVSIRSPQCLATSLGFTAEMDERAREKLRLGWRKKFAGRLSTDGKGASRFMAAVLANGRLTTGEFDDEISVRGTVAKIWTTRTLFDVLVPLLIWARKAGVDLRERYEQVAYEVLTANF